MRCLVVGVAAAACAHDLPPEQACIEVGYALAARTEDCTGDADLGVSRQEAFEVEYVCSLPELLAPEYERDLFNCALVVRNLACELAVDYGDDLALWLDSSPVCALILDPR